MSGDDGKIAKRSPGWRARLPQSPVPWRALKEAIGIEVRPAERMVRSALPATSQLQLAHDDLRSGDFQRQLDGVRSVRVINDARGAPLLLEAMTESADGLLGLAAAALEALGPDAIAPIVAEIERKGPKVQAKLLGVISRHGSAEMTPMLERLLPSADPAVRGSAALVLVALGPPVHMGARRLLESMGQYRPPPSEPPPLDVLFERLGAESARSRQNARNELWRHPAEQVVPRLIAAIDEDNGERRAEAVHALRDYKSPEVVAAVARVLSDDSRADAERLEAVKTLQEFGGDEAMHALEQACAASTVGKRATRALVALGGGIRLVMAQLLSTRKSERLKAARALRDKKDPDTLPALLAASADSDVNVRDTVADAVLSVLVARRPYGSPITDADGDAALAARLRPSLSDSSARVRSLAVAALGTLNSWAVQQDLRQKADDDTDPERESALRALRGGPRDFDVYARALTAESSTLRYAAIALVAALDDARVPDLLMARLNDPDDEVRVEAVRALARPWTYAILPSVLLRLASLTIDRCHLVASEALRVISRLLTGIRLIDSPLVENLEAAALASLDTPSPTQRERSIAVLARLQTPGARDAIVRQLDAVDLATRREAVFALIQWPETDDAVDRALEARTQREPDGTLLQQIRSGLDGRAEDARAGARVAP